MRALLSRHRRLLAAAFAAAAAALTLATLKPHPEGVRVLVAARDLPGGTVLTPKDVAVRVLPREAVPSGVIRADAPRANAPRDNEAQDNALRANEVRTNRAPAGAAQPGATRPGAAQSGAAQSDPAQPGAAQSDAAWPGAARPDAMQSGAVRPDGVDGVIGRALSGPVRRGEPLTDARFRPAGLLGTRDPASVAVPVRLADAAVVHLLHVGDRVDVLAARADAPLPARTVASAVPVVAVPKPSPDTDEGALIVVATGRDQAATLARAAVDSRLSVTILGS
jgi:pilus assembly protein CpaB